MRRERRAVRRSVGSARAARRRVHASRRRTRLAHWRADAAACDTLHGGRLAPIAAATRTPASARGRAGTIRPCGCRPLHGPSSRRRSRGVAPHAHVDDQAGIIGQFDAGRAVAALVLQAPDETVAGFGHRVDGGQLRHEVGHFRGVHIVAGDRSIDLTQIRFRWLLKHGGRLLSNPYASLISRSRSRR